MRIKTESVSHAEALSAATEIEKFLDDVRRNIKKAKNVPLTPICRMIQFIRSTLPNEGGEAPSHWMPLPDMPNEENE